MVIDPRTLIGVPFRLHGRDAATGLDCVGVVAATFAITGVPRGYSVRVADAASIGTLLERYGFVRVVFFSPDDVVLTQPSAVQCHLAVMTNDGFVHADAGLGRVVETPGQPDKIVGAYRWPH